MFLLTAIISGIAEAQTCPGTQLLCGGSTWTTATVSIANPFTFPGKFTTSMPASGAPMNMPSLSTLTSPVTDDIFNLNHVLSLYDGSARQKLLTDGGTALAAGQITVVSSTTGLNQLSTFGPAMDGSGGIQLGTASISSGSGSSASFGSFISSGSSLGSVQFFNPSVGTNSLTLTPAAAPTATFTLNLPNTGANDTLAALAATQTLSNKTLSNALFVDGANANATLFTTSGVAGATTYFQLSNAAGSSGPQLSALGAGTSNINATINAKGTGSVVTTGAALVVPTASGAAPTANGALAYDTNGLRYVAGVGQTFSNYPTVAWPVQVPSTADLLCSSPTGMIDSKMCIGGGTSETAFNTTLTLPSGILAVPGKTIRLNFHFLIYSPASPTTLQLQMRWNTGSTVVYSSAAMTPSVSLAGQGFLASCLITTEAAAGVNVAVLSDCSIGLPGWANSSNTTKQPVQLITNSARTFTITATFGSSSVANEGIQLQSIIPEVLQ